VVISNQQQHKITEVHVGIIIKVMPQIYEYYSQNETYNATSVHDRHDTESKMRPITMENEGSDRNVESITMTSIVIRDHHSVRHNRQGTFNVICEFVF